MASHLDDPFDEEVSHAHSAIQSDHPANAPPPPSPPPQQLHLDFGNQMNTVDLYPGTGDKKENIFPASIERKDTNDELAVGEIFEVTVSDPEKKGDGVYAYVSYKVNTKAQTSPGKFTQSSVVRRYNDFAWLHEQLTLKYPGYLIPPLPEKAIMGRFSPMFVDSRRRSLELFLNRIASHKELSKSDDVKLFLHGGQNFIDAKDGKINVAPQKKKGFFEYVTSVTESITASVSGAKEREKSKDDLTCEKILVYADNLEASVSAVHKNISVLTRKTKEIANAWFDFGFSCTLLGQYETEQEEPQLGNAFAKLGNCADRLSVLLSQTVDSQVVHFQEPFNDFLRIIGAVKVSCVLVDVPLRSWFLHYVGNVEEPRQRSCSVSRLLECIGKQASVSRQISKQAWQRRQGSSDGS